MSKSKFRVSANDAPVRPKVADVAPSYIPILDQHGNTRGHVHGLKSSDALVNSRFGVRNAKLRKINGVLSWQGEVGPTSGHGSAKLAAQRRQAKGSVAKHATPPQKSARPKR